VLSCNSLLNDAERWWETRKTANAAAMRTKLQTILANGFVSSPGGFRTPPEVTKCCMQFWYQSDAAFQQAVRETSAAMTLEANLLFVPGSIGLANARFAPTPWLLVLLTGSAPKMKRSSHAQPHVTAVSSRPSISCNFPGAALHWLGTRMSRAPQSLRKQLKERLFQFDVFPH